jgi:hypothetical protein
MLGSAAACPKGWEGHSGGTGSDRGEGNRAVIVGYFGDEVVDFGVVLDELLKPLIAETVGKKDNDTVNVARKGLSTPYVIFEGGVVRARKSEKVEDRLGDV